MSSPKLAQAEPTAEKAPSSLGTEANEPSPEEDLFVAEEFSFALPPGFREQPILPPKPAAPRPGFGTFGECVFRLSLHTSWLWYIGHIMGSHLVSLPFPAASTCRHSCYDA